MLLTVMKLFILWFCHPNQLSDRTAQTLDFILPLDMRSQLLAGPLIALNLLPAVCLFRRFLLLFGQGGFVPLCFFSQLVCSADSLVSVGHAPVAFVTLDFCFSTCAMRPCAFLQWFSKGIHQLLQPEIYSLLTVESTVLLSDKRVLSCSFVLCAKSTIFIKIMDSSTFFFLSWSWQNLRPQNPIRISTVTSAQMATGMVMRYGQSVLRWSLAAKSSAGCDHISSNLQTK